MGDFVWAELVPVGQRNPSSASSAFGRNLESCTVTFKSGTTSDLLDENSDIDEVTRLTILCAVLGFFTGIRNWQSLGFLITATLNAPKDLLPDGNKSLRGATIHVEWNGGNRGNKPAFLMTVAHLMDIVFLLTEDIENTNNTIGLENETNGKSSTSKSSSKDKEVPDLVLEDLLEA